MGESTEPSPPLLLIPGSSPALSLPEDQDNLFERLVRDPTEPNRPIREMLCTEMLCAVLRNTRHVRRHVLEWLGQEAGLRIVRPDLTDWRFETEQDARGKRIDLLIRGKDHGDSDRPLRVLLVVEVKVDAPLHPRQPTCYEPWMRRQEVEACHGFVLGRRSDTSKLTPRQQGCWSCISWTQLGLCVESVLHSDDLPPAEVMLAQHLAGFIRLRLWEDTEMKDDALTFNEIALLKAFEALSEGAQEKVETLTGPLKDVLKKSGLACGAVHMQHNLFKPSGFTGVWCYIVRGGAVDLSLGIEGGKLILMVQSSPRSKRKAVIRQALAKVKSDLQKLDGRWVVGKPDCDDWAHEDEDLRLDIPLETVLAEARQGDAVKRIATKALRDLKASGAIKAIRLAVSGR